MDICGRSTLAISGIYTSVGFHYAQRQSTIPQKSVISHGALNTLVEGHPVRLLLRGNQWGQGHP